MGECPQCLNFTVFWDAELKRWYCETYGCSWCETETERIERQDYKA